MVYTPSVEMVAVVNDTAALFGVDSALVWSIVHSENVPPNTVTVEPDGTYSYAPMQLKYETAQGMGFQGKAVDLKDLKNNVYYGVKYIKYLSSKFNNVKDVMSAYNAGENGVYHPYSNADYVNKTYRDYVENTTKGLLYKFFPFLVMGAAVVYLLEGGKRK